jgi:hypothetical protein
MVVLEHLHRGAVLSQIPASWGIPGEHFDVCKICEGAANDLTIGPAKITRKFA